MVAVAVAVGALVKCRKCDNVIARREGPQLIVDRSGVYFEFTGGTVLIQCHHPKKGQTSYGALCRENNRVQA